MSGGFDEAEHCLSVRIPARMRRRSKYEVARCPQSGMAVYISRHSFSPILQNFRFRPRNRSHSVRALSPEIRVPSLELAVASILDQERGRFHHQIDRKEKV